MRREKHPGGRPRRAKLRADHQIAIRVTTTEIEDLRRWAKNNLVSMATYVRRKVFGHD